MDSSRPNWELPYQEQMFINVLFGLAALLAIKWWKYYGVAVVLVTAFEMMPIHFHWRQYYGEQQALVVLGFPAWWWFVNAQSVFVIAALVYLLRKRDILSENRSCLLIPLLPMLAWSAVGSAAMPVFCTLTSTTDIRITTSASLLSILLALMNIWITGRLVTRPAAHVNREEADATV